MAVKHIYNSGLYSILLAVMKSDLGLSGARFGLLSTSGNVTSGATTMVAGYLGDRFANRSGVMLLVSLSMMGVSYFLLGIAPNYWLLFVVMLLVGIGPSLYHSPAIASLSRKFPDKRSFAISWHGTGGSVGEVVGPVLTGGLITGTYFVAFHWSDVLKLSVGPALVFALVIYLMMRGIPTGSADTESLDAYFSALFKLLLHRGMQALALATILRSIGQDAIMAFLPVYLLEDQSISAIVIGLFMASIQFVGILAQPAMGWLADRFGHRVVLVPSTAALGLLMIALKFAPTDSPVVFSVGPVSMALPGIQFGIVGLAMGAFLYALHAILYRGGCGCGAGRIAVNGGVADIRGIVPWGVLSLSRRRNRGHGQHIGRIRVWRRDCAHGGGGIGIDSDATIANSGELGALFSVSAGGD